MQDFFRAQLKKLLSSERRKRRAKRKTKSLRKGLSAFSSFFRADDWTALSATTVAASAMFFSYLDVILDTCLMLYGEGKPHYNDFRRSDWRERVFGVWGQVSEEERKLIDELEVLKATVRDSALHGLNDHISILVPIGKSNLIPISTRGKRFQLEASSPNSTWTGPDCVEMAEKAIRLFKQFERISKKNRRLIYARIYANSGSLLYFDVHWTKKLRSHMKSPTKFAEHLYYLSEAAAQTNGF